MGGRGQRNGPREGTLLKQPGRTSKTLEERTESMLHPCSPDREVIPKVWTRPPSPPDTSLIVQHHH